MRSGQLAVIAALILFGCAHGEDGARRVCEGVADGAQDSEPYEAWYPSASEQWSLWAQVLATSEGNSPSDIYGTAPPAGGPMCFLTSGESEVAVVYVSAGGASVIQPFTLENGEWLIAVGDRLEVLLME